jgi:membrane protein required for colicin V production
MSIFDIIFALLFCYAIYSGIKQGLVIQVSALISLLLGVYLAFRFSGLLAKWITGFGVGAKAVSIVSFVLTFIGVIILARMAGHVAHKVVQLAMLGWLNRLLGCIFSLAKMAVIISITLFTVSSIDHELPFMPHKQVQKSKLYAPLARIVPSLLPYLDFEKFKSSLQDVDKKAAEKAGKQFIQLPRGCLPSVRSASGRNIPLTFAREWPHYSA